MGKIAPSKCPIFPHFIKLLLIRRQLYNVQINRPNNTELKEYISKFLVCLITTSAARKEVRVMWGPWFWQRLYRPIGYVRLGLFSRSLSWPEHSEWRLQTCSLTDSRVLKSICVPIYTMLAFSYWQLTSAHVNTVMNNGYNIIFQHPVALIRTNTKKTRLTR
jgi:hypothetical protein